jgi:hypothetical protein
VNVFRLTSLVAMATLAAASASARAETYYGLNPNTQGQLSVVGFVNNTTYEVRALPGNALVTSGVVNRLSRVNLSLNTTTTFKLVTNQPVLAVLGFDCCNYSGSFFYPVEDGRKFYGTKFVITQMANGGSQLVLFARDASTVTVKDSLGTVVATSPALLAGQRWVIPGLVNGATYALTSTGVVAVQSSSGNGNTAVPPVPTAANGQLEDCNSDRGVAFNFATYGWDRGAFALFNNGASAITFSLTDLSTGSAVAGFTNVSVAANTTYYSGTTAGLGTGAFKLVATGAVSVWAGDTEGGNAVEWMGDDLTTNMGFHGMSFRLNSQTAGGTLFSSAAGTVVTVNGGAATTLGVDGTLTLAANANDVVTASKPVSIQTIGGNGLNDWAIALRPATALDTDGNGLDDWAEGGSCKSVAPDTDGDGLYDFEDTDDDNDCVLDINEPPGGRLNPLIPGGTVCPGATPVCDTTSGTCRQCLTTANCSGGKVCSSFVCTLPPDTTITQSPASPSNSSTGTFAFTSPGNAGATFQCAVDLGAYAACSAPVTTGTLTDGSHTFSVRAVVGPLTDPTPATFTWTIDTAAPQAPNLVTPANGSRSNNPKPQVSGTAEANATISVYVDGVLVGTTTADASGAYSLTLTSPLSDGTHVANTTARDAAGNVSPSSPFNLFTVDTTAPAAPVIVSPANGGTVGSATPVITGTAEANATVFVRVDGLVVGSTVTDGSGQWSFATTTPLAAGSHTVSASARDQVGNQGVDSAITTFTVDLTLLDTSIVSGPSALTNSTTATFVFASNKPGSSYECDLDGQGFQACSDPDLLVGLTEATHTLRVRAVHGAEVDPTPASQTWTIDLTPPAVPAVTSPAAGSTTADNTPPITGTGAAGSTVTVVVDGVTVGTAVVNAVGQWSLLLPTALSDGTHSIIVSAKDDAGNLSMSSAPVSFTVDTRAPLPPLVTTPVAGSTITTASPVYAGIAEANAQVRVEVDGVVVGTVTASSTGQWSLPAPAPLTDGAHQVRATAIDAVGNTSATSQPVSFTVDTTAPLTPVITAPASASSTSNPRPPITGTGEPGSIITVVIDGVAVGTTPVGSTGTWSFTPPTALAEGPHDLAARASDLSGNTSSLSTPVRVTVDTTAPGAPVITDPINGSTIGLTSPTLRGTAEPGANVVLVIDSVVVGTVVADATGAWSFPTAPLTEGQHAVTATARDAAGNVSPVSAQTVFTVDTRVLDTSILTGPPPRSNQASADFGFSSNKTPVTYECRLDQGTFQACANPASFTALADGPHTLQVRAVFQGVADTSPASWSWTIDTTPPAAPVVVVPASGASLRSGVVTVTGTAEPGSTVTVIVDSALAGTVVADASGAWSLPVPTTLADGVHTASARATDQAGNVGPLSATNAFTIDTVAPVAPTISAPSANDVLATGSPTIAGHAEPGSTVVVIIDGQPAGTATTNASGAWAFTPPTALTDGTHSVAATSRDAAGNVSPASSAVPFTVDTTAPVAPVVTAPAAGSSTNDATPPITGTAEAGSTVSVVVDGVSLGTAVADATGAWTFTPATALANGSHSVTATSRDEAGNVSPASTAVVFSVDTLAPAAPVIVSPAAGEVVTTATPVITGTAEAGSTVQVFVDGVMVGVVTADAAGNWTLALAAGQTLLDGAHTVKAIATDAAGNSSAPTMQPFTVAIPVDGGADAGLTDGGSQGDGGAMDGGVTDGGVSDAGADGGQMMADAGGIEDGGATPLTPDVGLQGGGCGCTSSSGLTPLLAVLAAWAARRRRQ